MKLQLQPSYKFYLALKEEFLKIKPVFSGMPDSANYNLAKKYYNKLSSTSQLSTEDFDQHCSLLTKMLAIIKKDANTSILNKD